MRTQVTAGLRFGFWSGLFIVPRVDRVLRSSAGHGDLRVPFCVKFADSFSLSILCPDPCFPRPFNALWTLSRFRQFVNKPPFVPFRASTLSALFSTFCPLFLILSAYLFFSDHTSYCSSPPIRLLLVFRLLNLNPFRFVRLDTQGVLFSPSCLSLVSVTSPCPTSGIQKLSAWYLL